MTARTVLLSAIGLYVTLGVSLARIDAADGGKAKNVIYEGEARPQSGNGSVLFTIDTSPNVLYLVTVNNKYHVLLIRVMNTTAAPLNLAKDQDTIDVHFANGQTVKGILNLPSVDAATWDGLETEIRTAVAYPQVVPAREEEGIYLYVRVGDVKGARLKHEMPSSLTFNIRSLPRPVELRPRGVAKA